MKALDLLRLQIEWGADEALEDAPLDRLRPPAPARPAEPTRHTPSAPSVAPSRATPAERAVAASGAAATLAELRAAVASFDGCDLRDTAANLVFAEGDPTAGLLLIGDPPGESEDRSGVPFAGPGGAMLERMLASVALTRQDLLLTPLIPWRPPGGRPPSAAEIAVCLPFLHRLIVLANPRRIILAGALPVRVLGGSARRRTAPTWIGVAVPGLSDPVPGLGMPGPTGVMHTPAARREAWAALRLLRRTLDSDIAEK
jgi:uracil-DNA glycosylase